MEDSRMIGHDLGTKWLPIGKNDCVRGLDGFKRMAERNGVRFRKNDFAHGEILTADGDENTVGLMGLADELLHSLAQLDNRELTRDEFLHKFPNNQGERWEAAGADIRFVSERNDCLPFAPPCSLC